MLQRQMYPSKPPNMGGNLESVSFRKVRCPEPLPGSLEDTSLSVSQQSLLLI